MSFATENGSVDYPHIHPDGKPMSFVVETQICWRKKIPFQTQIYFLDILCQAECDKCGLRGGILQVQSH